MIDFLLGGIIVVIIAFSALYVYRAKKKGKTCIGCPHSGNCQGFCSQKEDA